MPTVMSTPRGPICSTEYLRTNGRQYEEDGEVANLGNISFGAYRRRMPSLEICFHMILVQVKDILNFEATANH